MPTLLARRFQLLFFFLLGYLVLYPYVLDRNSEYIGFRVFGIGVTLLSVYAVSFRRTLVFFVLVLAIPTIAQRILLPRGEQGAFAIAATLFGFAFDILVVIIIFRRVFGAQAPNSETIFGALCVYLLVGFSFAGLYSMLAAVQTRAFYLDPASNLRTVPDRFDAIYYSFGTITSLGASGVTPVSDQARSLTLIEALLGVLYLAVLISKLVNAYDQNRASPQQHLTDASPKQ